MPSKSSRAPRPKPKPKPAAAAAGPSVSDQLRRAMRESGLTGYALARDADLPRPVVSRFLAETPRVEGGPPASLSLPSVDALCRLLGLQLAPVGRRRAAEK